MLECFKVAALDEVAQELVTLHQPELSVGLSKNSARDWLNLLLEQHWKREPWETLSPHVIRRRSSFSFGSLPWCAIRSRAAIQLLLLPG